MPDNEGVTHSKIFWSRCLVVDVLCSDPIYTYYSVTIYDSISTWYYVDDTKAAGEEM